MIKNFLFILIILFELINAELRINPPGIGKNNSIYILSANSSIQLDCEVELGDFNEIDDINSLEWIKGKMKIGQNWLSIYTQPKIDEKRRWLRQSLFIQKITEQNSGEYKCLFFDDLQKTINLFILNNLEWKTKNNRIGVPLGQSLTINCGAKGIKDENIKILDSKGKSIEESLNNKKEVLITGEEITLIKIGKEHQGLKIRCVAIRPINLKSFGLSDKDLLDNSINSLHTDENNLIIDVWIPPKFEEYFLSSSSSFKHYYAIPGTKQLLRWTIIESNPPIKSWTLKKDGEIFLKKEGIKIIQKLNETKPFFVISIENVQDEDYGSYTLIAHNGKLESQQTQILVITQPPKQPHVSIDWVSSNGSVSWKIEEQSNNNNNNLPITYFWIVYKPIKRISIPPSLIYPYRVRRRKNLNNLYEIAGLEPFTEYEFIFVGGNQAGESDPILINLSTIDKQRNKNNNNEKEVNNYGINLLNNSLFKNKNIFLIFIFYFHLIYFLI
ncbi:hypothetical protein Mgra_00007836 [Meloidogyne graminicola]|uniref:Fibronectin type-III domain-containing protein n=1 Tax=Meloidogyne graminicola TaxID=189291 RepID=A0A8S9ZHJ8_9BILA|nr:hypothetical protein Mgra_00007836 [Meloidogyne graminicola]